MWDIETFVVPFLTLLQPHTSATLLDYRFRNLANAASNARLRGRRGLQFPGKRAVHGPTSRSPAGIDILA